MNDEEYEKFQDILQIIVLSGICGTIFGIFLVMLLVSIGVLH